MNALPLCMAFAAFGCAFTIRSQLNLSIATTTDIAAERTRTPARPYSPACDQIWVNGEDTALRPASDIMASG